VSLSLFFAASQSVRADWPHLRGPNYDGVSLETNLADVWPSHGPPQLWSRDLGQGHSGLIVADDRVYTQRQTLSGQSVLCLDPNTGQTLWETRYDWAWQPGGAYPGPYASPTWQRGKLVYCSPTGLVGCVDARTGAPLWSINVRDKFQGKGCEFGYAATPLLLEDRVILPVGGTNAGVVALNLDDGRVIWTAGSDPASYCPAYPITIRDRHCVFAYMQNSILLIDASSGKLLNRQRLSSGYDEHSAWPLYREPFLCLTAPFRQPALCSELLTSHGGELTTRLRWTAPELSNDIVSSVLYREEIFGFNLKQQQASPHRASRGSFQCLDWATGELCWSTDRVGQASVVAADNKLYMLNDSGCLILARADRAAYQELCRVTVFEGDICWTPPTLWNGRLYVRSPSQTVCLFVGPPEMLPAGQASTRITPKVRHWQWDPAWLVGPGRDYPNDAPALTEMTHWFAACVLVVFGAAAAGTTLFMAVARLLSLRPPIAYSFLIFGLALGVLAPPAFGGLFDRFVLTWPASLYACFQMTMLACWKSAATPTRWSGWRARFIMLGFLLLCYAYFELCKATGMFVAWAFLFGLPCAFPFTYLAARSEAKGQRVLAQISWSLLAFTVFFWSCELLLQWKSARAG
jgi:outer membrane protein assembly factor BamB